MDCTICANEVSRREGFSASASTGQCEHGTVSRAGPSPPASAGGRSKTRNGWVGARMEPHMCNRPDVHGIAVWTCMSAATHVVVRLAVAPRPSGRRCRAVDGGRDRSDPPLSMPVVASAVVGMCIPSSRRGGSLRVHQSFPRRPEDANGGGIPTLRQAGPPPRTGGLHGRGVKPGRGALRRGRRRSRWRGQGRHRWPEPATTRGGRWQEGGASSLWQRRQPEEDRGDPPRPTAAFRWPSRQGLMLRERPREGRGEV